MVLAVLAVLAACTDDAGEANSLRRADPMDMPITTASISPVKRSGVFIQAPVGLPSELSTHLLARFQEASLAERVPLARTGSIPELTVKGVARAGAAPNGTAVALVWEVIGPEGDRVKLISGEALVHRRAAVDLSRYDPWAHVDEEALEEIADAAAQELAQWYSDRWLGIEPETDTLVTTASIGDRQETDTPPAEEPIDFTTPSLVQKAQPPATPELPTAERDATLAAPIADQATMVEPAPRQQTASRTPPGGERALFDVSVGTSPGDGRLSLAAAVQEALLEAHATAPAEGPRAYRVLGTVSLDQSDAGLADVRIEWTVVTKDGTPLGLVTQSNRVAAKTVAGSWGEIATAAGSAAAAGILELIGAPQATAGPRA